MKKKKTLRKIFLALGLVVATPIVLFLILAVLVYIPPVQRFIVREATSVLSDATGMRVHIGRVRLAFPLDLALGDMQAIRGRDTLVDARALRVGVRLWPLVHGRAEVNIVSLIDARLNTLDLIPDVQVSGRVGLLSAALPGGVDLGEERVLVDRVMLKNTALLVALSDTAREDTTPAAPSRWDIHLRRADIVNTSLALRMPGDSMRVGARLGRATIRHGRFDTGRSHYAVGLLALDRSAATYDVPQAMRLASGIDPNHIAVERLTLRVDSIDYDSAGRLNLNLRRLAFDERSGLSVAQLYGRVRLDTASIALPALTLRTAHSRLTAHVALDWAALTAGRGGELKALVDARLGRGDVLILAGEALPADLRPLIPDEAARLTLSAAGNMDSLRLNRLEARIGGLLTLHATGHAEHLASARRSGHADWRLTTADLSPLRRLVPSPVAIPNGMSARGEAGFRGDDYTTRLRLSIPGGSLAASGRANLATEHYALSATAQTLPLSAFLPGMGLSDFSGSLAASGRGFDPLALRSSLHARATVGAFSYSGYPLDSLTLNADMAGGMAHATFTAQNRLVQGNGTIDARLAPDSLTATLRADVPLISLRQLTGGKDSTDIGASIGLNVAARRDFTAFDIDGSLSDIRFMTAMKSVTMRDITFALGTAPDTTYALMRSGDLDLRLLGRDDAGRLATQAGRFASLLSQQVEARRLDQNALRTQLPALALYVNAGRQNPISKFMALRGIDVDSMFVNLNADTLRGLNGRTDLFTLRSGQLQLDSVRLLVMQDSGGVKMQGSVINSAANNPNHFRVYANAFVRSRSAGADFQFIDSKGAKGVDVGVEAFVGDSGVAVRLFPDRPVIAYRDFRINHDNYLYVSNARMLYANVDLLADDGTSLQIHGQPKDSTNDVTLNVARLNLGELSNVLPYMPRLTGLLAGDIHVTQDRDTLTAKAAIDIDQLAFEGTPLGNIGLRASYLPEERHHLFDATVKRNGNDVLRCSGVYADRDGGQFAGKAELLNFPLAMANGFMAGTDVSLEGGCNGILTLHGPTDKLMANGSVRFDSARVFSDVYGISLRMDTTPIVIDDNRLTMKDFALYSTSAAPLRLNGAIDFSDAEAVRMNLDVNATNYELINAKRKRESMVFGKVYTNIHASMRGTMEHIYVNGRLDLLGNTDMTYILKDSPLTVEDQLEGLVHFVNFADSTAAAPPTPAVMGMDLSMALNISEAAHFRCELSDDKSSYVDIEGGGTLNFRLNQQGDMRLTGRFTAGSGEMKYALPVIPLKTFQLVEGSYIDFLGDMMNPTLNIAAKERVKATVTENDAPRSVNFDVGIAITKPLDQMGLEFTIEAPEDLSVQNQLAAMTPEQRGKTAVTMLATGMFITDEGGTSGSGFKANDALNAFLQSEIQNIAGSALRTIDINLGVESGTSATGTEQTDYSFQFAKRFWGNRISIIIGGKVSTGADAENSAESFIDNVSIEYRLDKSSTRHVKVFYDRNTNDPLEGQLTKTGAGLVLRRKSNRLGELFIFRTPKPKKAPEATTTK